MFQLLKAYRPLWGDDEFKLNLFSIPGNLFVYLCNVLFKMGVLIPVHTVINDTSSSCKFELFIYQVSNAFIV